VRPGAPAPRSAIYGPRPPPPVQPGAPPPSGPRRLARVLAFAFAAVLALLGLGGAAFQLALPFLLPSPLDWRAAQVLLERQARPGDAVAASPAWAERLRMVAPPRLRVMGGPRFSHQELEGVRRVWLLSLPVAPGFSWKPELELIARATPTDQPVAVGRLEISRYEVSHPDLVLATLTDELARASVDLGGTPCSEVQGTFRCGGGRATASVDVGVVDVEGLPRQCLVARASGEPAPLALNFPAVPLGRVLGGSAGLLPRGGAAPTPLTVSMRVDGEEAGSVELDGAAWPSFHLDTERWAGQVRSVALEVVVPADRTLCLQAVTQP
jgi:hypothetical protein